MKPATRLALFLVSTFLLVAATAWASPDGGTDGGSPVEPPAFHQEESAPAPSVLKALRDVCPGPVTEPCVPNLLLGGEISEFTAEKFSFYLQMAEIAGAKALMVTILSPGGEIEASKTIAKAISTATIPVDCVAVVAASGAFLAFESCRTRYVMPKSLLITHEGRYIGVEGPARVEDLMDMAARLRAQNRAMAKIIAARLQMTVADYEAKVAEGDWKIDATDAVAVHAADAMVPTLDAAHELVKASLKTHAP